MALQPVSTYPSAPAGFPQQAAPSPQPLILLNPAGMSFPGGGVFPPPLPTFEPPTPASAAPARQNPLMEGLKGGLRFAFNLPRLVIDAILGLTIVGGVKAWDSYRIKGNAPAAWGTLPLVIALNTVFRLCMGSYQSYQHAKAQPSRFSLDV